MKRVKCKSGVTGWQSRVRDNWENLESLELAEEMYRVATRLGYKNAADLWKENPVVQGSIIPSDLSVVKK